MAGIFHSGEGRYGIENVMSINLWIKHLVSALRYCHDRSLIHSDVKPANLLPPSMTENQTFWFRIHKRLFIISMVEFCTLFLDINCNLVFIRFVSYRRLSDPGPLALLKLADFGVAFEVLSRHAAGTACYMPLAMLQGLSPADKYMDVFASAATLYEMVEGRLMIEQPEMERAAPELLNLSMWHHNDALLVEVFQALYNVPEGRNTNWAGWLNLRKAVKLLLPVDWRDGRVETWNVILFEMFASMLSITQA